MLFLDLTHTSHTRARTGVQRVAGSLAAALGDRALPICHDPYLGGWRRLDGWERANLASTSPGPRRGARWPLHARLRGYLRRFGAGGKAAGLPAASRGGRAGADPGMAGVICPEIFSPAVAAGLAPLFARANGPRVAVFHDAIALRLPEMTPQKTVARFTSYMRELLSFDGIAAVSEDSRRSLLEYWDWLGVPSRPQVSAIPLGVDPPAAQGPAAPSRGGACAPAPVVLCVGTIEARKNHVALLDACEQLWAGGAVFELRLIGMAQAETGQAALKEIAELRGAGRTLRYDGAVDDATLAAAYRECAFTVYPSLMEGFGLPVLESLANGRPCVCSGQGALGEAARGGGCFTLAEVGAGELVGAISRLLSDPSALATLAAEARARPLRTWAGYARELTEWMGSLAPRR